MNKMIWSLLLASNLFAYQESGGLEEGEKPVNFLEIGITEMAYNKPAEGSNEGGYLNFVESKLSRADLTLNIENKDEAFNADIIYEKDLLKFNTKYLNIDFKLSNDSEFNDIQSFGVKNALAVINPSFSSFGGNKFDFSWPDMSIGFDNFFLFCSANDPEVDMASVDGLTKGCLTELTMNVNDFSKPLTFKLTNDLEDNDKMILNANLNEFSIKKARDIKAVAKNLSMGFNDYLLETGRVSLACDKDENLFEWNTDKVLKECENTSKIVSNHAVLTNKIDKTKFFFNAENLEVKDETLNFYAPEFQIASQKDATTIFGLKANCLKDNKNDIYDLGHIISDCIKSGSITVDSLVTTDEKTLWWKYKDITTKGFNPTHHVNPKKKEMWGLKIELKDGEIFMKVKTKKGPLKFTLELKGEISYDAEKDRITIDADDVRIPVKFFWDIKPRKFLVKQIAGALVDAGASSEGNKIYIDL